MFADSTVYQHITEKEVAERETYLLILRRAGEPIANFLPISYQNPYEKIFTAKNDVGVAQLHSNL